MILWGCVALPFDGNTTFVLPIVVALSHTLRMASHEASRAVEKFTPSVESSVLMQMLSATLFNLQHHHRKPHCLSFLSFAK